MKRKKVRKPRDPNLGCMGASTHEIDGVRILMISTGPFGAALNPRGARRLARWLDRAADYLESMEGK